jgi:hypothetical protein
MYNININQQTAENWNLLENGFTKKNITVFKDGIRASVRWYRRPELGE